MRRGGTGWERMRRERENKRKDNFKEMESEGSEATVDLFG